MYSFPTGLMGAGASAQAYEDRRQRKSEGLNDLLGALAMGMAAYGSRDPGATAASLIEQAAQRRTRQEELATQRELQREEWYRQEKLTRAGWLQDKKMQDRLFGHQSGEAQKGRDFQAGQADITRQHELDMQLQGIASQYNLAFMNNTAADQRLRTQLASEEGRAQANREAMFISDLMAGTEDMDPTMRWSLHNALRLRTAGDVNAFDDPALQKALGETMARREAMRADAMLSNQIGNMAALDSLLHPRNQMTGQLEPRPEGQLQSTLGAYGAMRESLGGGKGEVSLGLEGLNSAVSGRTPEQEVAFRQLAEFREQLVTIPPGERGLPEAKKLAELGILSGLPLRDVPLLVTQEVPSVKQRDAKVLLEGLGVVEWTPEILPQDVKELARIQARAENGGVFQVNADPYLQFYANLARTEGLARVRELLAPYQSVSGQMMGSGLYNQWRP